MVIEDAVLREIVRRIVEGWNPEKIILFGSRARGDADPDSDYDIMVVMPFEGSPYTIMGRIYAAMTGVRAPKDILVESPDRYDARARMTGSLEYAVARDGVVIYERG